MHKYARPIYGVQSAVLAAFFDPMSIVCANKQS